MANKGKAGTYLELPPLEGIPDEAQRSLNDRFRAIALLLDAQPGAGVKSTASVSTGGGSGSAVGGELILSVPGTLGVRTDAAPRVSLGAASSPKSLLALVKRAPVGGKILVEIQVAGKDYAALTIPDGAVASAVVAGALAAIPVNALITLDVRQVGTTTFPGADLTVLVRF